ncbi:MAG: CopD family protein [Thermoprotei archaeon]
MTILQLAVLYIHVLSAIIFVGGSLFIWLALLPALSGDIPENIRNQVVVKVTKRFGRIVDVSLTILIITGIYNSTWYLDNLNFTSIGAKILLAKALLTLLMVFIIYFNNLYLGRRISKIVRQMNSSTTQGERESLRAKLASIRRRSRVFSYLNITLMLLIVLLAVMLQFPP